MGLLVDVADVAVKVDGQSLLSPVSFALSVGESLAITGANGSGKTTLLRVLAGLRAATSGEVRVGGLTADERDTAFRRTVASLIGPPPVARDLTLEEHLRLILLTWGAEPTLAEERARLLLEELRLDRLAGRFPHQLSSGQAQLLSLALTLARPGEVLVLDEPEQRLDRDRLEVVAGVLNRRVVAGTTLVFATHHRGLAEAVAHRTIRLAEAS